MGKSNRVMYYHQYERLYKEHRRLGKGKCLYCGAPEEQTDHVPAISWVGTGAVPASTELWLVPSCAECNRKLGSHPLHTIYQRLHYLSLEYYAEFKDLPEVDAQELQGLGHRLFHQRADLMLRRADLGERLRFMAKRVEEEVRRGKWLG